MRHETKSWLPSLVIAGSLIVAASPARAQGARPGAQAARPGQPPQTPQTGQTAPDGWYEKVQRDLAAREYEVSWQASPVVDDVEPSWQAPNRMHGFRTYFTADGIRVIPRTEDAPAWRWGLSLAGYGRGGTTWEVPPASLAPSGRSVEYRRGALTERYENSERGLEQSFTLPAPPGQSLSGGPVAERTRWTTPLDRRAEPGSDTVVDARDLVHVDLELWGDLSPRLAEDRQAIDFVTPSGAPAVRYGELVVRDARGERLPAWMEGFAGEGVRGIRLV